MAAINAINEEVRALEESEGFIWAKQHLKKITKEIKENILTAKKATKKKAVNKPAKKEESWAAYTRCLSLLFS